MDFRLTTAALLWAGLLILAVFSASSDKALLPGNWRRLWGIFVSLLAIALPIWRWRSLTYNGEINVDESQILAQALRYQLDPIPWRSVDGGSGGPLYTWSLFWAPLFGLKFHYLAARITGLLCYWLTCAGLSLAAARLAGKRFALLLTMPAVTLSLSALNFDYVFFSSEQLPMAIMAWACFFLALQVPTPKPSTAYLLGLLTGALPFCKIQVGPAGVVLWMLGAVAIWLYRHNARSLRRVFTCYVLGGLSVATFVLFPVVRQGAWDDFVTLYLKAGVHYQSSTIASWWNPVGHLWMLINAVPEFRSHYIALGIIASGVSLLMALRCKMSGPIAWAGALGALFFAFTNAYSIVRSGYPFAHYTLLLVVPVTILACLPPLLADRDSLNNIPNRSVVILALVGMIPQLNQVIGDYSKQPALLGNWGSGIHPIGEVIQKLTKPEDTILVWGYAPKFHVFSGVPPSYRVTTTLPLLMETDMSPESPTVMRYLSDLEKHPPALIIDAPDEFWFPDPKVPKGAAARHFLHPPTSNLVSKGYELAGQMNYPDGPPGTPKKLPIFIYKKKT